MSNIIKQLGLKHRDPAIKHLVNNTLAIAKESGASKEVIESLEKGLELSWLRLKYEEDTTTQEGAIFSNIFEKTMSNDWTKVYEEGKTKWNCRPGMISGQVEGQFLKSFLSAARAKDVLEVGMFTGYTALSIAEALPADGKVVTLDQDEYLKDFVRSLIQDSPHKNKVDICIGDARDMVKKMSDDGKTFDAVFLDASKSDYELFVKLCFDDNLLRPNGTVIVDNAFFGSQGYTNLESDSAKFAEFLKNRLDLHVVLVPIKDGIFVIRRQTDVDGGVN